MIEVLTPTSLFLLLNVVIATIFFTSVFGFGSNRNKPQTHSETATTRPQLFRAPSLFSRVTSFNHHHQQQQQQQNRYSHLPEPDEIHIQARPDPPSLLARVASFCRVQESREGETNEAVAEVKERKVAGEKIETAPEKEREVVAGEKRSTEEEVDAKADDFINRFKQQLKMQRLESLLRYRKIVS